MKNLLLIPTVLFTLSANAKKAQPDAVMDKDTIITMTHTVTEVNATTNDTIIRTTVTEEVRRFVAQQESDSYVIDENNNRISFFWDAANRDKKKHISPHWSGFGIGFVNYSDRKIPYGGLNMGASLNFTFNFFSAYKRLGRSNFLIYTGLGTEWAKYKFNDNAALTKVNGVAQFVPAPEGVGYVSSKLLIYHITVPFMLEYQDSSFHMAAGVLCMFKWRSRSQVRYYEEIQGHQIRHKETQSDLNILPVNLRLKAQIGLKNIALFGYYDPISMFKYDRGPEMRSYVIGGMLLF